MSRSNLSKHPAVSFTVRRPPSTSGTLSDSPAPSPSFKQPSSRNPPVPSPNRRTKVTEGHAGDDSSDEGSGPEDEIITGFDALGVQRKHEKTIEGPLIIAPLANRDWRAAARKRQTATSFIPDAGRAAVGIGADGSVGGLGTRDSINSGPQLSGIILGKEARTTPPQDEDGDVEMIATDAQPEPEENLTEDQKALRAILAGDSDAETPSISIIPTSTSNQRAPPTTETDAYREDVLTRPESSSLEDYERIPVEQFGAALLRGMGWKEGMAASKTRKGPTEPYVPPTRPALLGIGAKEREAPEDGGVKGKNGKIVRPDKKYVPLIKRAKDGSTVDETTLVRSAASGSSSRRASRSPPPRRDHERERSPRRSDDSRRDRHDDRSYSSRRDRGDYSSSRRDRDDGYSSSRSQKDRTYTSSRDKGKEYSSSSRSREDYVQSSYRDQDRGSHSFSRREGDRDKDRGKDRDREIGKSRY